MRPVNNAITAVAVSLMLTCTPAFAEPPEVRVDFDGGEFSASSPDLFQGKADLSPGDVFTSRINITNNSEKPQLFLLALDTPDILSTEGQTLLEAAELVVSADDGFPYYEGPLAGTRLKESVDLEVCDPGETLCLDVEIHVPSDLGNGYAMSRDMLHWRFTAMPVIEDSPSGTKAGVAGVREPGSAYDKTGYNLLPAFAIASGLLTVGIASFAIGSRRRK